jgi:uncharacterized protein
MTTRTRKPGEFCWINMLSADLDKARAFYTKVLGWTYADMPGMGFVIKVGGRDVGGLFDVNAPATPKGTPPHIGIMVKVENADAAGKKVGALGGKAMPAFDIKDSGRMAVCYDPNGAAFDVWEPKKMQGFDVDGNVHGAPCWIENLTTDVPRATTFYSALFGWTAEAVELPGFTYTTFKLGGEGAAGMMPILPQMGDLKPHWGTYFTVDDADNAAGEAVRLGATLCVPPQDIPEVGRFAGVISPQGVMFYVIKHSR